MKFVATLIKPLRWLILKKQTAILLDDLRRLRDDHYRRYRGQLPPVLIKALVAAEDHRFYLHCGVDPIALIRAAWQFIRHARIQGASTIEQQLVRTRTKRYERTVKRKIREIMLATCLAEELSKQEIAGIYLTVAYYGWGMEGLARACATAGIQPESMTAYDCAVLVARLRYPRAALPHPNHERLFRRRVERIMHMIQPEAQKALSRGMANEVDVSAV